jgi:16S rRNA (guanine527-N7)-methyltransferase
VNLIEKYFPQLTQQQKERFLQLQDLYNFWNAQINVISRKDMEHFYERHVLHSLGIAKVVDFKYGTSLIDVGTGGGFPGIPLAVMYPDCEFLLTDSIGKKIKVVQEISNQLGLANVDIQQIRAEQVDATFDFVLSRGVAPLIELKTWMRGKINKPYQHHLHNGLLALKGGDLTDEIKDAGGKAKVFELNTFFEEDFFETKKVVYLKIEGNGSVR